MPHSGLSDDELRKQIKEMESQGHTGIDSSRLHALNCDQTNRLSDSGMRSLIRSRLAAGKPVGKLVAAARDRGISY